MVKRKMKKPIWDERFQPPYAFTPTPAKHEVKAYKEYEKSFNKEMAKWKKANK